MSIWDTASAAIDAVFAVPGGVTYAGPGIDLPGPIAAIREDMPAPTFDGPGASAQTVGYEIEMTALPRRPRRGDLIGHVVGGATSWRVIDVSDRAAVGKWFAIVEQAA